MKNILLEIAAHKKKEVEHLKKALPLDDVIRHMSQSDMLDFKGAISSNERINIIAEIKKASPSKGIMLPNFDPAALAGRYKAGGAAALSVLTDEKYFQGAPKYLEIAKESSGLPVLCKEFIINAYQIYYARLMRADAVLLIVKLLSKKKLQKFMELSKSIGLAALVEVHDEEETRLAVDAGAEIIGVNNRHLEDFGVSLEVSEKLSALIPKNVIGVAESGITGSADIKRLNQAGYNCFLVGEALVKSPDPVKLLKSWRKI